MNSIGRDFDKWARSKEYRGYIYILSFNIKYDAKGYFVLANPRNPDYHNQENLTKNLEKYFPQTYLYIDRKIVSEQEQTDLSKFIQSESSQLDPSKLSKAGHRKIAYSSKSLTYNKKVEK
ncbi:4757_t:CDS:2, partial [Scutellospora calospora]